uniref:cardiomyopathy-associated protein 5-like n=1 Tax=Myxine glutinosa TaxID=7769 RepID=UPI00358F3F35
MEGLEERFKTVVQNPLMKPKIQTIFSSAEFSMVSAQCETSRISWETFMPHSPASARRAATFGMDSLSPVCRPQGRIIFTVDEHLLYGLKPVEGKSETLQSPIRLQDSPSVVVEPEDTVTGGADLPDAALLQSSEISCSATHQLKDERKTIDTDMETSVYMDSHPKEISVGNNTLKNDSQSLVPAAGLDSGHTGDSVEKKDEGRSSPEQGDASSGSSLAKCINERGPDVRPLTPQHHEEPQVIDFSLDGTESKGLNEDVCGESGSESSTNDIFDDNEEDSETEEMLKRRHDIYCISCKKPISALDKLFGCHELHDVTTLNNAARLIKVMLNENMMVLKDRVNDIRIWQENQRDQHQAMEKQTLSYKQELVFYFEELMDMLSEWQEAADTALQLGKQEKLEGLYSRLVPCRLALENARDLLSQVNGLKDISDANTFLQAEGICRDFFQH